ncbi:MAG: nitrogen regulation protein NR(II) [Opitutales bacterium]
MAHRPGGRMRAALEPLAGPATLAGLLAAAGYWLLEAVAHAFIFHLGGFRHELLPDNPNELWMRSLIVVLLVALGALGQWHRTRSADLRMRLRRLAGAVEQAGEAMLITDTRGRIEYVNPAFTRLTGYRLDEVRGQNPSLLRSGATTTRHYEELWATINAGRIWSGSVVDRRKDGTYYPALLTIAPVADPRGRITHFIGIQQDLTTQVELEERVHHSEKLQALGTFAGGIAHDFGNILGLLSLQLELARQHAVARPEAVGPDLGRMEPLLDGATRMVQDLSDFARRGATTAAHQPLELRHWLEGFYPTLRLLLPAGANLTLTEPGEEIWVSGNDATLQQVLVNLVQNACDALAGHPAGLVTLSCELVADGRAANPAVTHLAGVACARLCVVDNGPGVDPDLADRIFEPFFTTKGAKGTGLGLAMARDTLKRHGGSLRLLSSAGKGAVFELLLPLSSRPVESVPDTAEMTVVAGSHRT